MTSIIDYRMGNLRSVQKALERLGAEAVIVRDPDAIRDAARLILPGVGAFTDGMQHLREAGFDAAIRDFVATGRPFLGICLGMQLLFDASEEDAPNEGLGLVPGRVVRFQEEQGAGKPRLKVPHMGWNQLDPRAKPGNPLFAGITPQDHVYFVHGYHCVPDDPTAVAATCGYGKPFCASVWRDNLYATQFHPEKSQAVGLKILENFLGM
jgi:glutamine amidotransferase